MYTEFSDYTPVESKNTTIIQQNLTIPTKKLREYYYQTLKSTYLNFTIPKPI